MLENFEKYKYITKAVENAKKNIIVLKKQARINRINKL